MKLSMRNATRAFNPIGRALSGRRWVTLYGLLVHRGRTSGREYRTPLVIRPIDGGFVIPLPFGESTQWAKNLLAAGRGQVVWNGRAYEIHSPEVVDRATASPAFMGWQRAAMERMALGAFVRVRTAGAP